MSLGIDLLREWDEHNRAHRCYYDSAENDGMGVCPSDYDTLGDFLDVSGFPVASLAGLFFGRKLSEPNFRSKNRQAEKPVSIREAREKGVRSRVSSAYYTPSTDAALERRRQRAQEAAGEPRSNTADPWQVDALDYFKERLDKIETALHGLIGYVVREPEIEQVINDERSESGEAGECEFVTTFDTSVYTPDMHYCTVHDAWTSIEDDTCPQSGR